MGYNWNAPEAIPRQSRDPYANWLAEVGQDEKPTGLQPIILQVLPGKLDKLQNYKKLRQLMSVDNGQERVQDVIINRHDAAHFVNAYTMYPDQLAELLVFLPVGSDGQDQTGSDQSQQQSHRLLSDFSEIEVGLEKLGVTVSYVGRSVNVPLGTESSSNSYQLPETWQELVHILPERTEPSAAATETNCDADASKAVITAVIDHAIPFASSKLFGADKKTRVAGLWRQGDLNPSGPAGVAIGTEWNRQDINDFVSSSIDQVYLASESLAYTALGLRSRFAEPQRGSYPLALSSTHGAQIIDVAAGGQKIGNTASVDEAGVAMPVLAVELPPQLVAQTNGFQHEPFVKSALNWIWWQMLTNSDLAADKRSLAVNFSFAGIADRNDGQGILDADFQLRLERGEIDFLSVPAGNSFQLDGHATLCADAIANGEELELWVQPDTETPTFVELWLDDENAKLPFELKILPPAAHELSLPDMSAETSVDLMCDGTAAPIARVFLQNVAPAYQLSKRVTCDATAPLTRSRVTLAIRPTGDDDFSQSKAPAGRWRLVFAPKQNSVFPTNGTVQIWVERNDTVAGFPARGRQAYFTHPTHQRRDDVSGRLLVDLTPNSPIQRQGTLSSHANGADVFVAAAVRGPDDEERPASYTSAGRVAKGASLPTLGYVVEQSAARPYLVAGAVSSGAASFTDGTSAAAALATRHFVQTLVAHSDMIGRPDHVAFVKGFMIGGSNPLPAPSAEGESTSISSAQVRVGSGVSGFQFERIDTNS